MVFAGRVEAGDVPTDAVDTPGDPEVAARTYVLDQHAPLVAGVAECADRVAAGRVDPPNERAAVVEPLSSLLSATGCLDRLPDCLAGAVEAAGYDLRAAPVAAPPYVAVTSVGPVCRATVADGRLVVSFELFAVGRTGDRRTYRRRDCEPPDSVVVELRS